MKPRNIVIGQKIDPAKLEQAKKLRRAMTTAERRLWQSLRANRLQGFHFRRQQIIDGFIVDFYCHVAALVVEVDGPVHDKQADYDAERDRILSARGLRVLRVRNFKVMQDLKGVLTRIEAACRERVGPNPPTPFPAREGGAHGEGSGEELPSPRRGGAGGGVS